MPLDEHDLPTYVDWKVGSPTDINAIYFLVIVGVRS